MKKIVFSLAAFAALSLSAATHQDPPPTQVTYHGDCPATVTAGTTSTGGDFASTYTENKSSTRDVRTTVTDRNGYSTDYHTGAKQTSEYNKGYVGEKKVYTSNASTYERGENRNVSKIDVYCSPAEKK